MGGRAELIMLAGGTTPAAAEGAERVIDRIRAEEPRTVVLHHDLRDAGRGLVRRRMRLGNADQVTVLELAQ